MQIKKVSLAHFRNYSSQSIEMAPKINMFYGENAQGKTNILEAIYFLSTSQSPRTNKVQELISWGEQQAFIEGIFQTKNEEKRLIIQINRTGQKIIKLNQQYLKKTSELLGLFPVIYFSPEDLEVIKKTPQGRRRFMDVLFSQTSKKYTYHLLKYQKILKQRNECLKQIAEKKTTPEELDAWDEALIEEGSEIVGLRKEGLKKLIVKAEELHQELTANQEALEIKYISSLTENKDKAREELKKYRRNEIITQKTCLGPHRDDLVIMINQREAKTYASHGQQRTAMLSLKLAELDYMENTFYEKPVVLLDDILLELDSLRLAALLKNLFQQAQTIITGTEKYLFAQAGQPEIKFYKIQKGSLAEKNETNAVERNC
ncbi:MAG: DNA replication/repair protein RecF [Candidatus Margulisbacteria bacterium]|nr:DNA replication/repair protein RecF [Candidatus Margulisiibacteriota bacterium]